MRKKFTDIIAALFAVMIVTSCSATYVERVSNVTDEAISTVMDVPVQSFDTATIPEYTGMPYIEINNNIPAFTDTDMSTTSFEEYSSLDNLGRCGVAYANLCTDTMPTEERGEIGMIKPSGWATAKYDFVDGKYLYNRCHLIGFQLSGENANEKNLITGTRYMNVEGMLPFENLVADYIHETGNHVLYRVTPVFEGNNLVSSGVEMEALSVEDNGSGICFNVFCYNVQPGVVINYATGENHLDEDTQSSLSTDSISDSEQAACDYILNINSKKFHLPSCESISEMSEKNKQEYTGTREELLLEGYSPCDRCKP